MELGNWFLLIHCLVLNAKNEVNFTNHFDELNFRNVNKYLNINIAKKNVLKRRGYRDRKILVATTTTTPTPKEEEYQQ